MIVGTQVHEGDAAAVRRQQSAVAALSRLPGVQAVNVQFQKEPWVDVPGIEMMPALLHDSATAAGSPGRRKPLTRELFDVLARVAAVRGARYFAFVNSDILILPAALEALEREVRQTYAISRYDVDDLVADVGGGTLLTAGIDMFVMSVDWWRRHCHRFRSYVIGDACWDNVYTAVMMCHSDGLIFNRERLILHERHASPWHDATTITARYNGFLAALDARYFSLWCEYFDRLEEARAQGVSAAGQRALRDEVFVWRRSATAALRQSARNTRAWLSFRYFRACLPPPAGRP
jgi:hypothetical protein